MKSHYQKYGFWAELAALLLLLLILSPYQNRKVDLTERSFPLGIWYVNTGLGIHHTGHYPAYFPGFMNIIRNLHAQHVVDVETLDLCRAFPAANWQVGAQQPLSYVDCEPFNAFINHLVWQLSGVCSIHTIISFLIMLHFLTILFLFVSVWQLGVPGMAFLAGAILAYSPVFLKSLFGFATYVYPLFSLIAVLTLVMAALMLLLKNKYFSLSLVLVACAGLMLAAGSFIRTTTLYSVLPIAACFAFIGLERREKKWLIVTLVLVGVTLAFHAILDNMIWTPERLQASGGIRTHFVWAAIWAGLGEFPNHFGFINDDASIVEFFHKLDPSVIYPSPGYELAVKKYIFQSLAKDPGWFLNVLGQRILHISHAWADFLPVAWNHLFVSILFLISLPGAGIFIWLHRDWPALMLLAPLLADLSHPLLINSSFYFYNFTGYLGVCLSVMYFLFYASQISIEYLKSR